MYTPRDPNARPAMKLGRERAVPDNAGILAGLPQHEPQDQPARKPARRLTRNPVLAGIVNNAMRMWK